MSLKLKFTTLSLKILRSWVLALAAVFSVLSAQEMGYLRIQVDTTDIPVFVDGIFIQNSPVNDIITLHPGFHEVSLIPPELNTPLLKSRLTDANTSFYVAEKDTVEVTLRKVSMDDQISAFRGESILSQYVGWFMMGIVLYLAVALSG